VVFDGILSKETSTGLSGELGTTRVTVYADRARIREALEAEGLRDFIK
jgi:hypothetical protein